MKVRARRAETVRTLLQQARKHEWAADALSGAARRFTHDGYDAGGSLAIKACHAHRVWALMARTRAHAMRVCAGGHQE
ncbi:MAG TPA: hypothetical protein VEA41_08325 [Salinarimonas sp.]|nr:hypothetical protein [Salinarimonas sp.]